MSVEHQAALQKKILLVDDDHDFRWATGNILQTAGYAKTKEVDTAQGLGAGKYIKKPYTLEKIGLAVKEELEK
ncbi:MAG: response regulator [Chloroflexota bacterium]